MGVNNRNSIVTNGLLLYLDAGNPNSYPGSGTTWNDLSGNGFNATLSGTVLPTYTPSNGGGILFNSSSATNQCATTPNSTAMNLFTYTLCGWINPNGYGSGGKGRIIDRDDGSAEGYELKVDNVNVANGVTIDNSDGGGIFLAVANQTVLGQWVYFCGTFLDGGAGSGSAILYKNGVNIGAATIQSPTSISAPIRIGNTNNSDRNFDGIISIAKVYNRVLSGSEILQNYNAQKSRFNLT